MTAATSGFEKLADARSSTTDISVVEEAAPAPVSNHIDVPGLSYPALPVRGVVSMMGRCDVPPSSAGHHVRSTT